MCCDRRNVCYWELALTYIHMSGMIRWIRRIRAVNSAPLAGAIRVMEEHKVSSRGRARTYFEQGVFGTLIGKLP